jgi:endonuclease III
MVVGDTSLRERDCLWREQLTDRLLAGSSEFDSVEPDCVYSGLERLHEINRRLEEEYGTPHLENKDDPVDELVYIILSRRTRETAYQTGFNALKDRFSSWDEVLETADGTIEEAIRFSGLGKKKATSIKCALTALAERFGTCTLEPARSWTDDELMELLCSLPEVGPKSASCVMMWSLDRPSFPVDAHVGRVLERIGVWSEVGLSLKGTGHKAKQAILADLVPPSIRRSLHVNALVHGRNVCKPARPGCDICTIALLCDSAGSFRRDPTGQSTGAGLA